MAPSAIRCAAMAVGVLLLAAAVRADFVYVGTEATAGVWSTNTLWDEVSVGKLAQVAVWRPSAESGRCGMFTRACACVSMS